MFHLSGKKNVVCTTGTEVVCIDMSRSCNRCGGSLERSCMRCDELGFRYLVTKKRCEELFRWTSERTRGTPRSAARRDVHKGKNSLRATRANARRPASSLRRRALRRRSVAQPACPSAKLHPSLAASAPLVRPKILTLIVSAG